jgi:hypothetical protein
MKIFLILSILLLVFYNSTFANSIFNWTISKTETYMNKTNKVSIVVKEDSQMTITPFKASRKLFGNMKNKVSRSHINWVCDIIHTTKKDESSHIESLMIQCSMDKWKSIVAGQTVCAYFRKSKTINKNHSYVHLGQSVSNKQWHITFHVNCES